MQMKANPSKPSLFIYHTHDDFDSADPSSMQSACHIWTRLNDSPWVLVAQWIERPPGVLEVMGSIPVDNSEFFFVPRSCHFDQFTYHNFCFVYVSDIGCKWRGNVNNNLQHTGRRMESQPVYCR